MMTENKLASLFAALLSDEMGVHDDILPLMVQLACECKNEPAQLLLLKAEKVGDRVFLPPIKSQKASND